MSNRSPQEHQDCLREFCVREIDFDPHIVISRRRLCRPTGAKGREIWVMGNQGDNLQKVLAVRENEWLSSVRWSPDGQRLAYIRGQLSSGRYQFSIETCDLKGANRPVVVPASDLPRQFCWLPDGRMVCASDENLWQIGIDNNAGTPIGKLQRITQWAGSYLWGLSASADGKRLVFHKETGQAQVYLGELAAGGGPA